MKEAKTRHDTYERISDCINVAKTKCCLLQLNVVSNINVANVANYGVIEDIFCS